MIVLDLMLPDDNGLALCQWVQQARGCTPVIMLTAQGDPASRIVGLEMGSDGYLAKPFEPIFRVESSLNRHNCGTGLGLYIARDLTPRQGGQLSLARR